MLWNEKIDLIKKRYAATQFLVPHVNRKQIFRKIETEFIKRPASYYELNNQTTVFSNWWKSITCEEIRVKTDVLEKFISDVLENDFVWLMAEFPSEVLLYKSTLKPLLDLIVIGQTWTRTFHVVHLKYQYMISFHLELGYVVIKLSGKQLHCDRLNEHLIQLMN